MEVHVERNQNKQLCSKNNEYPLKDSESSFNVKVIVNKRVNNEKNQYLNLFADGDRLWINKDDLLKDGFK